MVTTLKGMKSGSGYFYRAGALVSIDGRVTAGDGGGGGGFIAHLLNSANTGVPSGTSLTDMGASHVNYSTADNGVFNAKHYRNRVNLGAMTGGITFTNCLFDVSANLADGYALVTASNRTNANVVFDHCTFEAPGGSSLVDCTCFLNAYGVTVNRCHFSGFDNAGRLESNCVLSENLFDNVSNLSGAHVDGVEMYAQNGPDSNIEIRDNAFRLGPPNDWAGAGGITCCVNCTCDYGDVDDIRIYRNLLLGGSFTAYLRDHPSTEDVNVPTNIQFIGNRCDGSNAGFPHVTVRRTDVGTLKYWAGNVEDSTGTPILIPGLGIERPPP